MTKTQKAGNSSTNLMTENLTVNIALNSMEDIAKQLLNSVFWELSKESKVRIIENQASYFDELSLALWKLVQSNEELKKTVSDPDFQYASKKAWISASRRDSKDLHSQLASLIIGRIEHWNDELKRIVYNEAIETIDKLTPNQLKILTLCFLIKKTKYNRVSTVAQFYQNIERYTWSFVDFKNTPSEFEHIVYTGCASISIGSMDMTATFKSHYEQILQEWGTMEEILRTNPSATKLLQIWNDTSIKNMNLTSVWVAIAISNYERVFGEKMDINIWVN